MARAAATHTLLAPVDALSEGRSPELVTVTATTVAVRVPWVTALMPETVWSAVTMVLPKVPPEAVAVCILLVAVEAIDVGISIVYSTLREPSFRVTVTYELETPAAVAMVAWHLVVTDAFRAESWLSADQSMLLIVNSPEIVVVPEEAVVAVSAAVVVVPPPLPLEAIAVVVVAWPTDATEAMARRKSAGEDIMCTIALRSLRDEGVRKSDAC